MAGNGGSILQEVQQVGFAVKLIEMGARLPVLEAEVDLNRHSLVKLYREVMGKSPPTGMLPYSEDWFLRKRNNLQAAEFLSIYRSLSESEYGPRTKVERFITSFLRYKEQVSRRGDTPLLDATRAWTLLRFVRSRVLKAVHCRKCSSNFVRHIHEPKRSCNSKQCSG